MYIIGGWDVAGRTINQVDRINLRNGEISSITPLNCERSCACAVGIDNYILVFGGYNIGKVASGDDGTVKLSSCEKYDPNTNR